MNYCFSILLALFILVQGCVRNNKNEQSRLDEVVIDKSYERTISPDGKIESTILLHSRMGIRVELNLHKQALDLWISPQAGKSFDNRYRNFSCRDDHTSIFDKIWFPELADKKFIRCDYDPFHSVIYFEGQTMHLATLLDQPIVLLWTEEEEVVDFKSDKQDSLLEQSDRFFGVRHPDRGLTFDFYAGIGGTGGIIQHQPEVSLHRSIYARTVTDKNQFIVIGGELEPENVKEIVSEICRRELKDILSENEKKIAKAVEPGSMVFKNVSPDLQKLYDINQRHMLSVQDASGAVHAALRYVYYLIWATDGTVVATSMMQTGNQEALRLWCEYILSNPTEQDTPPEGRFYGQLVNKKITKREEFGSLCAVWPAFMYYGLTGDNRFVSGEYLELLTDVVVWMERYCYDEEMNAIGTYYLGGGSEDPFLGSNDYGYDAAVGSFMNRNPYYPKYEGKAILRAYEFNMNLNQYNMYLMLSSVTEEETSKKYLEKAHTIAKFLNRLDSLNASAYYLLEDEGLVLIKREEGENEHGTFAIQNSAPASFSPNFHNYFINRMNDFKALDDEAITDKFATGIYGRLAGLDNEFVNEDDIIQSIEVTLPYNVKASRFIPMPYSMVEYFGAEEGSFHDIRPQAFSTAPYMAALVNLSIRTLPYGIALRGTKYISELKNFEYLNGRISVSYSGNGNKVKKILLNDKEIKHTLQIPDNLLKPGESSISVELNEKSDTPNQLVYSTVRLNEIINEAHPVIYNINGYSQNILIFKNLDGKINIIDSSGKETDFQIHKYEEYSFIGFWGKGAYRVELRLQNLNL